MRHPWQHSRLPRERVRNPRGDDSIIRGEGQPLRSSSHWRVPISLIAWRDSPFNYRLEGNWRENGPDLEAFCSQLGTPISPSPAAWDLIVSRLPSASPFAPPCSAGLKVICFVLFTCLCLRHCSNGRRLHASSCVTAPGYSGHRLATVGSDAAGSFAGGHPIMSHGDAI